MDVYQCDGEWLSIDDNGDESVIDLPQEWVICGECNGEGKSLCDGMRGHAYSAEEFYEAFDEDERHGYFNGRYDTPCNSCNSSGKVKEINWDKLEPELAKAIQDHYQDLANDAATYRAEMGY